jgi:hypothetical protein
MVARAEAALQTLQGLAGEASMIFSMERQVPAFLAFPMQVAAVVAVAAAPAVFILPGPRAPEERAATGAGARRADSGRLT